MNNVLLGNNSINRIAPIDLTGLGNIRRAEIKLGGSGGVDNIIANPEPGTVLLLGSGLAGLALWGWRKKRSPQNEV